MTEPRKAYLIGYRLARLARYDSPAYRELDLRDPAVADAYYAGRADAIGDIINPSR
jgi:hypothetical protein